MTGDISLAIWTVHQRDDVSTGISANRPDLLKSINIAAQRIDNAGTVCDRCVGQKPQMMEFPDG
jgi:hypothetical protein